MSDLIRVIDTDCVPPHKAVPVEIEGRWYIVCNNGGVFHIADFHCPHENGPLAGGDIHNGCIICPVHHWRWNLHNGQGDPPKPHSRLKVYRCEVRDGKVYADVSKPLPPGAYEPPDW